MPIKQNGPPFGGPFVFDIEPISWPVPALGLGPAQEPVRALVPGQAPVLQAPEQARVLAQVRPASSVPPVRARGPVCWPPAARLVPGAHHFFRKHNTRQPPE
ncbi:hypothetical protein [Mesorhizobium sp. M0227]|uniref:hypothetical protein n=1 Tax=unclassified Mesorhizobium TaxID=325217 RepID=UPI0033364B3A